MSQDIGAVRAVIDEVLAAWAANDAGAFVRPYAEDATATLPGGFLPDRRAIHETMARLFAGELAGTRMDYELLRVRRLGAGAALAIAESAVVPAGRDVPDERTRARDAWVLERADGAWRVAAYHSTPRDLA